MSRKILVADASVTFRKIVEITFGDTNVRVETAASGSEALDRFAESAPDLVIADVVMPGPSGYEVCERIKASERPVPVLLLAGTFEPFDRKRAASCGADGHLVKPFESRTLLERVEELLSRPSPARGAAPGGAGREEVAFASSALERLSPEALDAVAREVVSRLSREVLQEIAWEVVPDLAEAIIRDRLREIEREERDRG